MFSLKTSFHLSTHAIFTYTSHTVSATVRKAWFKDARKIYQGKSEERLLKCNYISLIILFLPSTKQWRVHITEDVDTQREKH